MYRIMLPPKVVLVKYRWKLCWRRLLLHVEWITHSQRYHAFDVNECGCSTNCRQEAGYIGFNVKMIHTGGHAEGRTFNLVREGELIPLLPVYTRSSNASLFSLSQHSSVSPIHLLLLPPALLQLSQHPHTPFMSSVWGCVHVQPDPLSTEGHMNRLKLMVMKIHFLLKILFLKNSLC